MRNLERSVPFYVDGKCWHRLVIKKHFRDKRGEHYYERCRWCPDWFHVLIYIDKNGRTQKKRTLIPDAGLENESSKSDNPKSEVADIDTETGQISTPKPKGAL